mmetsp:Transcript_84162/g.123108  ORF Transcript_84162/g.123108 Transcript_84162/m.123108 type:complete len:107 (+) Transcript_84162:795-1115(+)
MVTEGQMVTKEAKGFLAVDTGWATPRTVPVAVKDTDTSATKLQDASPGHLELCVCSTHCGQRLLLSTTMPSQSFSSVGVHCVCVDLRRLVTSMLRTNFWALLSSDT